MAQNWNNVVQYIKANFGIKSSNLEFTDDELIEYFKEHTLSMFSQHIPKRSWALIDNTEPNNLFSQWVYKLNVPEDITILDVVNVYKGNEVGLITSGMYMFNPVDTVMANTLSTMVEHLLPLNTFEFIQPNLIKFDSDPAISNTGCIVEIYIEHTDLNSIPRDMYHKLFKEMCLADAFTLIINTRNKFTNVTTPFGQVDLNIDYLQQRLDNINQKISEMIYYLPHRDYLVFV